MYYNCRFIGFIVLTKAIVDVVDSILFRSRRMRRSPLINDAIRLLLTRIYRIARTGARVRTLNRKCVGDVGVPNIYNGGPRSSGAINPEHVSSSGRFARGRLYVTAATTTISILYTMYDIHADT